MCIRDSRHREQISSTLIAEGQLAGEENSIRGDERQANNAPGHARVTRQLRFVLCGWSSYGRRCEGICHTENLRFCTAINSRGVYELALWDSTGHELALAWN